MIKCCSPTKAPKIAVEFNSSNIYKSDYFTTSTFNNVAQSQVGFFLSCKHENIQSFKFLGGKFHSLASELSRTEDVILLLETCYSAYNCHDVQGYTGFYTYRPDKTGGGVSVFINKNCYTSTHMHQFF